MLFICYNYVLLLILSWWLGETDAVACFDLIWLDVCIQRPNVTHVQNWKLKAINWMGFLRSGFLMIFGFIHLDVSLGLYGCLIILVSLSSPFTTATTLYDWSIRHVLKFTVRHVLKFTVRHVLKCMARKICHGFWSLVLFFKVVCQSKVTILLLCSESDLFFHFRSS